MKQLKASASAKPLPKNVTAFTDRHGRTRYRFRKAGIPTRYIQSEPGTAEFEAEVAEFQIGVLPPDARQPLSLPEGSVVYFIAANETLVKIGTTANLRARLSALQTSSIHTLRLLATIPGGPTLEKLLHKQFRHARVRGEWFERTPELEELLQELASLPKGAPNF